MESTGSTYRYINWKSPEEMHYATQSWISELNFIKEEHHFFEEMIGNFTLPILASKLFEQIKENILQIEKSKINTEELLKKAATHKNEISILLEKSGSEDDELRYKADHRNLLKEIVSFSKEYKKLKKQIFLNITSAIRHQKQNRLIME